MTEADIVRTARIYCFRSCRHPRLRPSDGGHPYPGHRRTECDLAAQGITAPPNTLLHGAYDTMIASLKGERAAALDQDYVNGQVEYQRGNSALFQDEIQNGTDLDLKEFAPTLPKIQDHLQRALKLAERDKQGTAAE
jgi:Domain of unknown function (DUF4142)